MWRKAGKKKNDTEEIEGGGENLILVNGIGEMNYVERGRGRDIWRRMDFIGRIYQNMGS